MTQQPLVGQGLLIIDASQAHSDTPHSVGLLWPSDLPIAETSTSQQSQQKNVHASGRIRTRNPSNRLAADPRHKPRGHWKRHFLNHSNSYRPPAFTQPLKIQCGYTPKEEMQLVIKKWHTIRPITSHVTDRQIFQLSLKYHRNNS